jgi:hypothetical protein
LLASCTVLQEDANRRGNQDKLEQLGLLPLLAKLVLVNCQHCAFHMLLLLPWTAPLQEDANRRANQDKLGQLGLLPLLAKLGADGGGAPLRAVRAQVEYVSCTNRTAVLK